MALITTKKITKLCILGLSLILYMDKEEYLKQISEGYGARVLVHDKDTYPYPLEEGFFVPSSSETQIGLRMVRYLIIFSIAGGLIDEIDFSGITKLNQVWSVSLRIFH